MIVDLAKMMTGLMVRSGVGPFLRTGAFGSMCWVVWRFAVPMVRELASFLDAEVVAVLISMLVTAIVAITISVILPAMDGRRPWSNSYYRKPWGLADFVGRMPFICWCLITDDGMDIPLWAILVWPVVAVIEITICAGTILALPCWGLWLAITAIARLVWQGLNVRPLGSSALREHRRRMRENQGG